MKERERAKARENKIARLENFSQFLNADIFERLNYGFNDFIISIKHQE